MAARARRCSHQIMLPLLPLLMKLLLMTPRLQSTWSLTPQSPQATQATLMPPAMSLSLNPLTKLLQRSLVSLTF